MSEPTRPRDEPLDLRLVPVCTAAWAAAWWATGPSMRGAVVQLVFLLLFGAVLWHRGARLVVAAVVVAWVGCLAPAAARHHQLETSTMAQLAAEHAVVAAEVRLDGDPVRHPAHGVIPESVTAQATVVRVDGRGASVRQRLPVELRATAGRTDALAQVPAGARLQVSGRAAPAEEGRHSAGVISVSGPVQVVAGPGPVARAVNGLRAGLRGAMRHSPPQQAGLLPSLVEGDTSGLDPSLTDAFKATALTHLTAVSGTNLTLTLAFLLLVARTVGVRGWWVRGVGVAGVAVFVVVCRAEPSVVRAAAMGLVALAGLGLAGGRGRGLRNLCVAVWALMLVDPWLSRSVGFALSALATGGILWWGRRWTEALSTWAPRALAEALAVPLAAQLATQAVVTSISGSISAVGLLANALAEPFVGPATVLGLVTLLVAPVWPWLAGWIGWLAGWCVQPIIWIAVHGSSLPAATWRWPSTPVALVLLTALCLAAAIAVPVLLSRRWACALAGAALVAACWWHPRPMGWPGPWSVAFCDVGQGDATVLRAEKDAAVLVDTGPADGHVLDCLRALGVRQLTAVVLTHYHDDHIAGLANVLGAYRVGSLVVNPVASPEAGARHVRELAAARGVPVRVASLGEHVAVGGLTWDVDGIGAQDVLVQQSDGENSAENDTSIVLVARTGGVRVVVGGDVEPAGQQRVVASGWQPDATILKMPHHGSSRQDLAFWCDSHARLAVASAGYHNSYGHPARAALALASRCGMDVARTDLQGTVTAWLDGERLQVRSSRDGPP